MISGLSIRLRSAQIRRQISVAQIHSARWRAENDHGSLPSRKNRNALRLVGRSRLTYQPEPLNLRTTFSRMRETGPSKPFRHRLPQKVIDPTENTAPPLGLSK